MAEPNIQPKNIFETEDEYCSLTETLLDTIVNEIRYNSEDVELNDPNRIINYDVGLSYNPLRDNPYGTAIANQELDRTCQNFYRNGGDIEPQITRELNYFNNEIRPDACELIQNIYQTINNRLNAERLAFFTQMTVNNINNILLKIQQSKDENLKTNVTYRTTFTDGIKCYGRYNKIKNPGEGAIEQINRIEITRGRSCVCPNLQTLEPARLEISSGEQMLGSKEPPTSTEAAQSQPL